MVIEVANDQQLNTSAPKCIVKYRHNYYDITDFSKKHPGGINTLTGLNNTDMTARFLKAPPHSDAAMYLLNEYKIHPYQIREISKNDCNANDQNIHENGIELLEHRQHGHKNNQLDESLEHLVDWSKAMLPQISSISKYYNEWVHKPVDRPLRLFGPWYLEIFTKSPWWIIPLFWLPIITKCIQSELLRNFSDSTRMTMFVLYFVFGILIWTILEYSLHRWLFHMKIDANVSGWLCTLHFLIHGLHHKVPFDAKRLVFPPLPALIIASIIYTPVAFVLPYPRILLGGTLFGYICYDLIHYYLHYGSPRIKMIYHMKRYHYQHHFSHQDMGYGISSPLWDFIFSTQIKLRNLKFKLHWK